MIHARQNIEQEVKDRLSEWKLKPCCDANYITTLFTTSTEVRHQTLQLLEVLVHTSKETQPKCGAMLHDSTRIRRKQ